MTTSIENKTLKLLDIIRSFNKSENYINKDTHLLTTA